MTVVAHLDGGECYATDYESVDFGPALSAVFEAAHALVGVTTHANVTGPAYTERKDYYALLRKTVNDPTLDRLRDALGLSPR